MAEAVGGRRKAGQVGNGLKQVLKRFSKQVLNSGRDHGLLAAASARIGRLHAQQPTRSRSIAGRRNQGGFCGRSRRRE